MKSNPMKVYIEHTNLSSIKDHPPLKLHHVTLVNQNLNCGKQVLLNDFNFGLIGFKVGFDFNGHFLVNYGWTRYIFIFLDEMMNW
jgi:hypothetical protein